MRQLLPVMLFLSVLTSCTDKKYKISIVTVDPETKALEEDVEEINAEDDTTAFKIGLRNYWAMKAAALQTNKTLERQGPVPALFHVTNDKGFEVDISETEKERLSKHTVEWYKDSVLPRIDTMTPLSKRVMEKQADIY